MVNRDNWKYVRAYLRYRREVDRISKSSQRLEESRLRQLLQWADARSFSKVMGIRPVFPEYLENQGLSRIYVLHVLRSSRRFLGWLRKHEIGFSVITEGWLDTLKPSRGNPEYKEHEAVTLEEIRAMACASVETIGERRIRASVVFWFLSGIRVGAFVTLPLSAVDLENRTVKQWPKLGVKTKFGKHATTFLLDMPDLLEVVQEWDREVREAGARYWFAHVDPETGKILPGGDEAGKHRDVRARKDLQAWLGRVGLLYHSPHKFRHGHATYALKGAKDVPALKAISQNLMHKNLSVTDGVYAILSDFDVKEQITELGKTIAGSQNRDELIELLKQVLKQNSPK
ncbi:MAG: hypothetical protein HZB19_15300 [Chloroflexi bacterium]|nr:hypothetical protein [Chloroflexota bacterium]